MSGLLAGKVWQSNLESHLKPLAAAMADIANDDGSSIFPSVAYLAWLLGKGERSVQYGLGELKSLGVITAVAYENGGRGKATEYVLLENKLPSRPEWKEMRKGATSAPFREHQKSNKTRTKGATSAPINEEKGGISHVKGCNLEQERVQPAAPDPSLDTSVIQKPGAHARLMAFHAEHILGDVPHPGAQGKAVKWLLDRFTPEQCERTYADLKADHWRTTPVTWLTVQKEIGDRLQRASVPRPGFTADGQKILTDDGERYTVMGDDGTPSKRWRTSEAFAQDTRKDVEEVRAKWN